MLLVSWWLSRVSAFILHLFTSNHVCCVLHYLPQDTFGVPSSVGADQRVIYHTTGDEASRLYAKKTIVVGNVSKYVTRRRIDFTHSVFSPTQLVVAQVFYINGSGAIQLKVFGYIWLRTNMITQNFVARWRWHGIWLRQPPSNSLCRKKGYYYFLK